MKTHKKRIGIYGGTFNPIHVGHLQIASTVVERAIVDEVWLMISPLNPFKQGADDILPDDDRLRLATKALEGNDRIKASDYEFHLPIPSYTWNTLQHLKSDYADCEFVLVIGADNWTSFPLWKNYLDIIAEYEIVVYPRSGQEIDTATLPQGVTLIDMPLIDVSSTDIRERIARRRSIRRLVPPAIIDDCIQLYRRKRKP